MGTLVRGGSGEASGANCFLFNACSRRLSNSAT